MATADMYFNPRDLRILGTGAVRPPMVSSADLEQRLDLKSGSISTLTGVVERGVFDGTAAELGARSARQALEAAGVDLDDLDVIICANATRDQQLPYDAALLHAELAPSRPIPCWDLGASCLSFTVALDQVATLIDAGRYRRALVVSTDLASVGLDWSDLGASAIFGDGAAAAVLGPAESTGSRILGAGLRTWSEGAHLCEVQGAGSRFAPSRVEGDYSRYGQFRMDGGGVMRLTARHLPQFVDELLTGVGLSIDDVVLVPHQASNLGLAWLQKELGVPSDKLACIYPTHGNQVAASLPSALHHAISSGQLQRGGHALLLGTGAGISIGGVVLCY